MPTGDVAISLYAITITAAGTQVYGTVSISLPAITVSSTSIPGSITTTDCECILPSITISSEGGEHLHQIEIPIPSILVSSTGITAVLGNVDLTSTKVTVSSSGIAHEKITSDADISLPAIKVASTGSRYQTVSTRNSDIELPGITVSSSGYTCVVGTSSISIPSITVSSTVGRIYGDVALTLPCVVVDVDGYSSISGTCNITLPIIDVDSAGRQEVRATVSITLPVLSLSVSGRLDSADAHVDTDSSTNKTYVMNISNRSITEYINFNFNSYCRFNGVYFGAKANGIYLLGGDTGETTLIKSNIRFPAYNIPKPLVQKPREVWSTFRSNGQLLLTIRLGEDDTWENIFSVISDHIDESRVVLAKGFKENTYEFGIKNVGGANFDLESVRVMIDELRGKPKKARGRKK